MTFDLQNAPLRATALRRIQQTEEPIDKDPGAWFRADPDIWTPPATNRDPDIWLPPTPGDPRYYS